MAKNFYIQGDTSRAQEIKAAFEKLGYNTNVNGWNFNTDCGVYFTNEADKSVDYTSIETFVNLIKTHPDYQELELPVEPCFKEGNKIEATITYTSLGGYKTTTINVGWLFRTTTIYFENYSFEKMYTQTMKNDYDTTTITRTL